MQPQPSPPLAEQLQPPTSASSTEPAPIEGTTTNSISSNLPPQPQQQQQQQPAPPQPQQLPPPLQPQPQLQPQSQAQQPTSTQPPTANDADPKSPSTPNSNSNANNRVPTQGPPTVSKNNILEAIEEFDSSIPDAVVHHFLNVSGMQTSDQRIVRLIAVAAQKFIHDIVSDSLQHCKLRGTQGKKTKEKKYTLAIEDLSAALAEYGIEVRRQQYFN